MLKYMFTVVLVLISCFQSLHGFFKLPKRSYTNATALHHHTGKILADLSSFHDYEEVYREMMRISRESLESDEDLKSKGLMGEVFKGDLNKRRGGPIGRSAVGRRRARSQAIRREKLNSQSLRSHLQHTHQAVDYSRPTLEID